MRRAGLFLAILVLGSFASGQETPQPASIPTVPANTSTAQEPAAPVTLTGDQIKELIREAAEKDIENDKKLRDYTYTKREEQRRLNSKGEVQSTESKTYEVMVLYGEQVERLVAKNDKPLSEKDAAKEEERIAKITSERKHESEEHRAKRLKQEEKDREEGRQFVSEVSDAYNFHFDGVENLDGRSAYVIDAEPRPGFEPHSKQAKFLPKIRFRVWIDVAEHEWVKVDAQCIDTISVGLFLARIHKGTQIVVQQTPVNGEVWLPKEVGFKLDARVALLKNFNVEVSQSFKDYKKFHAESKIVGVGEVEEK